MREKLKYWLIFFSPSVVMFEVKDVIMLTKLRRGGAGLIWVVDKKEVHIKGFYGFIQL